MRSTTADHRRARLKELLDQHFPGDRPQKDLLEFVERRGYHHNQGELSTLIKEGSTKSFGEKKARKLADMIGLGEYWFDHPLGTFLEKHEWRMAEHPPLGRPAGLAAKEDSPSLYGVQQFTHARRAPPSWPFSGISPDRFFSLGPTQRSAIERTLAELITAYESAGSSKDQSNAGS